MLRGIPRRTRRYLTTAYNHLRFQKALRQYMRDPLRAVSGDTDLLKELVSSWGNTSWSADEEYLRGGLELALSAEGTIVECGSGLSTVLLGVAASQRGRPYIALEHMPEWGGRVRASLTRGGIKGVRVFDTQIVSYGDFEWYEVPENLIESDISLLLCDGPPGETHGGRYGFVKIIGNHLKAGSIILLDDAERVAEQELAVRLSNELSATSELCGNRKPYFRITVG